MTAGHLAFGHNQTLTAAATMLLAPALMAPIGIALSRAGTLDFPWMRSRSSNLVAVGSNGSTPDIWLVAHIDSKSQTIPMLVRIASVAVFAVLYVTMTLVLLALAVGEYGGISFIKDRLHMLQHDVFVASFVTAASALPIVFCFIGNRSSGAADNASGVAALLLAARLLQNRGNIGVLITSGEELGLAGARAFVRNAHDKGIAINCDTIDDDGRFICMASGSPSSRIDAALRRASPESSLRLRGMLPGVLADNIAFTDAGWEAFTLSRGNLRTLTTVHTSKDAAGRIQGSGIVQAAKIIAATVEELT